MNADLKDIIMRTLGASGISMKSEVAKKDMRRRASKFSGMSIALSLTVNNNRNRWICQEQIRKISIFFHRNGTFE